MWLSPLLALALAVPPPPPPDLPAELQGLVAGGALGRSRSGVEVFDLDGGRVIFASHARDLLNPASNSKIFTSAAALARLGPDYRWVTEVLLDAPPRAGVVHGNLTLRGHGDPTLVSERLWALAAELWHRGLRKVEGDLVLDDDFFDGQEQGPGWDQEDTDRAYLAPISALASNWGSVAIYVSPGERPGQRARVEVEPASPYFQVENRVVTAARGARHLRTSGAPARDGWRIRVAGRIGAGAGTVVLWRHVGEATRYTGETFRQMLAERGIRITGKVRRGRAAPASRLFYATQSDELAAVLRRLNKESSNFIAEMLVKTMGAELRGVPGSWPSGIDVVEDFLAREVGIPRGAYVMRNGSGLNDVNRFSAEQVIRVLAYMWPRMTLAPEYLSSLPIAGRDGTLRFRMEDTAAAGRVRAKTGTLEDVSALSGYVESLGGRHYAVSLLVNDYPSSLRQATAAEDGFTEALAAAGGAPAPAAPEPLPVDAAARRARADGYARLAARQDPADAPKLFAALGRESDPALRALAAEALYRCDPDDPDAVEALVDDVPASAADVAALLRLAQEVSSGPPLVGPLVDVATDGDPRGLQALLALAASGDGGAAPAPGSAEDGFDQALADGLAEVAQEVPRQLLEALAAGDHGRALRDVRRLAAGLAAHPDAAARFRDALAEAEAAPQLLALVKEIDGVLAAPATGKAPAGAGNVLNLAVPHRSPPAGRRGG